MSPPEVTGVPVAGRVTGSVHTGFQVADIDRSIAFYVGLLGMTLRVRDDISAPYLGTLVGYPGVVLRAAYVDIPGSDHWLELLEYHGVERAAVDPATANPGTAHICLTVTDLQAMYERMLAEGVRFVSPPVIPTRGMNKGRLAVYALDPDGIRVELLQLETVVPPNNEGEPDGNPTR